MKIVIGTISRFLNFFFTKLRLEWCTYIVTLNPKISVRRSLSNIKQKIYTCFGWVNIIYSFAFSKNSVIPGRLYVVVQFNSILVTEIHIFEMQQENTCEVAQFAGTLHTPIVTPGYVTQPLYEVSKVSIWHSQTMLANLCFKVLSTRQNVIGYYLRKVQDFKIS